MRLLILSDLHHEVWRENAPDIDPDTSRPDVVILAGDIDKPAAALAWAQAQFADVPVIYVIGNHESYGDSWERTQRRLKAQHGNTANVHLLDRGEVVIDGVRFLGATLWTDYALFGEDKKEESMAAALPVMVDYRRIQVEDGGLHMMTPDDTVALHRRDAAWLAQQLAAPFAGPTVVVTHMAPSMQSVAERYADDLVSAAFSSNLDALAAQADLWVHGHTHDSFDYRIGQCRVVCNPCGYIKRDGTPENARFDPDFIVEL